MADERLREIAEQVTSGLCDDPELRLDVQAEVLSHLKDTARVVAEEGKSNDEAADFAVRTFGSPVELADSLREANRPRMKTRALLRLAARALLIPAAVLLAVLLGYGGLARLQVLMHPLYALLDRPVYDSDPGDSILGVRLPTLPALELPSTRQHREAQEAMLERMRGKPANTDDLRAVWVAHQHDVDAAEYFAYYAAFLSPKSNRPSYPSIDEKTGKPLPGQTPDPHTAADFRDPAYEHEMRLGMRIDPTNACYHYKLASYFLERGIYAQEEQTTEKGVQKRDYVLNQQYLDLGLREFQAGLRLPICRYYGMAMVDKRLALLPPPRYTEDYLQRITLSFSELFPYLAESRSMVRKVCGGMRVLVAQGRVREVEPLLCAWKPLGRQLTGGAELLIALLVANTDEKVLAQTSADIDRKLGRKAAAQRTLRELQQFTAPIEDLRARARTVRERARKEGTLHPGLLLHYGSMLTSTLMPIGAEIMYTKDDLAPLWLHQRVLFEEGVVAALMVLLTFAMLWTALHGTVLLLRARGKTAPPLLLLPPRHETLKIAGYGVLLPLLVYEVYLHTPILNGWAYGGMPEELVLRTFVELLAMGGLLLYMPVILAQRYLWQRCRTLGMTLPGARTRRPVPCALVMLGWLGLLADVYLIVIFHGHHNYSQAVAALTVVLASVLLYLARRYWLPLSFHDLARLRKASQRHRAFRARVRKRNLRLVLVWVGWLALLCVSAICRFCEEPDLQAMAPVCFVVAAVLLIPIILWNGAQYRPRTEGPARAVPADLTSRGTIARSLVPVYALTIVLLAAYRPYLAYKEAKYLAQDHLILIRNTADGGTPIERKLVRTLQHDMLRQADALHFPEAGR
ncbi:MAG TPA: hypothetical protein VGL77_10370 [Armatimonadota bacterium]|jgi:hypothetical protein